MTVLDHLHRDYNVKENGLLSALTSQEPPETAPEAPHFADMVVFSYMTGSSGPGPTDAETWQRVRFILLRALELPAGQRSAYLDQACGADPSLRQEVESLLSSAGKSAFFDRPASPSSASTGEMDNAPAREPVLKPGQAVAHYRIIEKIGAGGMGTVYKALDTRLDRPVALKVISPEHGGWSRQRRFVREAKAASALNHPNIVTIYEFNSADGLDYISMEYIQGATLQGLLAARQLPLEILLHYARQAAAAVAKAHAAGIVHRDLKTNNIMVTTDGLVKVLDFGLAKQESASPDPDATRTQSLTRPGVLVGTPAYMAPEQVKGETADWRVDIFAFGVILYEIACGRKPFRGKNQQATLYQIAQEDPPAPAELNPATPPALAALIERCLKKQPEERPQSMAEVSTALVALTQEGQPAARTSWRRGFLVSGIVGSAAVAAGLLVLRQNVSVPAAPALVYSLEAQKMEDGRPLGHPYIASATDIFQAEWRFRLRAQSAQGGYLYLVNQGPDETGRSRLWILYPQKASGAPLVPGQPIVTGWFVFDANPGAERLWLVWSRNPLDTIERSLGSGQGGRVESQDTASAIQRLLAGLKRGPRTSAPGGETRLESTGLTEPVGDLLELRHE